MASNERSAEHAGLRDLHDKRVASARRRCFLQGLAVNTFLVYYAGFGLHTLFFVARDAGLGSPFFLGLIPVSVLFGGLWTRSPASFGRLVFERTHPVLKGLETATRRRWIAMPSGLATVALLVLTLALGGHVTDMSLRELLSRRGLQGAGRLFGDLLTPRLEGAFLLEVLEMAIETIFMALMATIFAVPVAFVASFFTARNLMSFNGPARGVYAALRLVFNFSRSVEPLIWAIIFSVWVGLGAFAGMLALMVHSVAALAKLYSEQIEGVDRGPIEAIEATGANRVQVVWYAVVPQIVLPYLSFTIYRWDINVRMATVIGLVGGGGLGGLFTNYQGKSMWHHVGTIVIVIALVVWVMDYLSARIREAIY